MTLVAADLRDLDSGCRNWIWPRLRTLWGEYPGYFMDKGVLGVRTVEFIGAWNKLNRVAAFQDRKNHEVTVIHLGM